MDETLYRAAYVVPVTSPPISDGVVHICNGRIVAVGSAASLIPSLPEVKVVDFGPAILMPPLVNAHTHLELTDINEWQTEKNETAVPEDFAEWILQLIRVKSDLEPQAYIESIKNGLQQSLESGTGVFVDILSQPELDSAYNDSPLLGRIDCELIGQIDARQTLLEKAGKWLDGRMPGMIARGLSPHAPYTVAADTLTEIVALAENRQAALSIHTAETESESELLHDSTGVLAEKLYPFVDWPVPEPALRQRPGRYLDAAGALRPSTLLVHGVHLTSDEIGRIGQAGCSVVLCPRSNKRLNAGVAPVEQFLCRDINLALGTDSLASNDSLSIWDEMEAARSIYADTLTPIQIVGIATYNGAQALGLEGEVGSLSPGLGAHFLVLKPSALPDCDSLANFLCQGSRRDDLTHLFLHGKETLHLS